MKLAITGGSGLVGRFLVHEALAAGNEVTILARHAPRTGFFSAPVNHVTYDLTGSVPELDGFDALVHAAFSHVPGRYRGGEGDDPDGFLRANRDGTLRLFTRAQAAGVRRLLFLSSRAVYGVWPPGTALREAMVPRPDTLYGAVKLEVETALAALATKDLATASVRATGVYGPAGPGQKHKWCGLFADFFAGAPIAPRVATEVHGADLASAMRLLLTADPADLSGRAFNVSDLVLDRRDLLAEVARLTGVSTPLPARADAGSVRAMDTSRLRSLGWTPGAMARLRASLPEMIGPFD